MNNNMSLKLQLIKSNEAFLQAKEETLKEICENSDIVYLNQGQTLLRSYVIESHSFLLLDGTIRLLAQDPFSKDLFTVGKALPGELIGIIDVLRQGSCEGAIARQKCRLLSIPNEIIVKSILKDNGLLEQLKEIKSPCEGTAILSKILKELNPSPASSQEWIINNLQENEFTSKQREKSLLSTVIKKREHLVGCQLKIEDIDKLQKESKLPLRFWVWKTKEIKSRNIEKANGNEGKKKADQKTTLKENKGNEVNIEPKEWRPDKILDLAAVGLKEATSDADLQGFRIIKGKGPTKANLATLRMVARAYNTPCPIDIIKNSIEGAVERAGSVPIHGMGQLAELMGLQTQVGEVDIEKLHKLELPVLVHYKQHYSLITQVRKGIVMLADPEESWVNISMEKAQELWSDKVKVLLLKRLDDTPEKTFGWGWFAPVLKRFQWSLIQVLIASLFIQLFQLANPLLIQQIIDKVITQSNLSALQVLGAALVTSALFQGLLTAVRTWLLIDTTDRMDLLLGSQVIDKLLRLPLRFFEKRPVGELSQRLSELGTLRGFLTGTAITSALDLLFAVIYIIIMVMYSPMLTIAALSTIPIYILIIVFIAPLYRTLIRKQAVYAAKTQSHLIETLGGIQTVKAQHFELNSRWKWQERYSGQIAEGFKSVVLGSTAGEFGNFLNQLSSLLIIWVGVYQVINGELSLGQLIAFRIIAGYVTGPILRLSGLWQGFQQVGISMERLSDIVDQVPETGIKDAEQIALPPIKGDIKFEDTLFRFGNHGPYQINRLDLEISSGSFIGIVGQSGSGKSTLMKLLPRLYEPNEGRILIDGYDISKVNLSSVRQQIGIVPQDCLLFEGTITDNICMNHPEADTESIIRVARASAAHDFIMELPEGYATKLGERGAGLSGGQRQRIAIARTLLQNPNLLILDEATSALDYDTEASVCRNLQQKLTNKTVLFITHRLSTVRHADKIILMHQGKIAEEGTHTELIALGGRYATLYAHQGDA